MSRYPHDAKVYVGDLGNNASKQEIEDAFGYYGPLRNVWVARNPPGFAFVEFEDARDAEDSVRGLDGRTLCGRRCRVELSTGKSSRGDRDGGGSRDRGGRDRDRGGRDRDRRDDRDRGSRNASSAANNGRPFHPDDRCYECGDRGHYARDCSRFGSGGGSGGGGRSGGRSARRRSSRSKSRSRSRELRTRSRSYSRSKRVSRSASLDAKDRSRSKTPKAARDSNSRGSKSKSRSVSRARSSRSNSRQNGADD